MKIKFGSEHNLDNQILLTSISWLRKTPTPFVAYFLLIKKKTGKCNLQLQTKKKSCPLIYEFLDRKRTTKPRFASSFMYLLINLFRSTTEVKIASWFTSVSFMIELVCSRPANLSFFRNTGTFSKLYFSTLVLILRTSLAKHAYKTELILRLIIPHPLKDF